MIAGLLPFDRGSIAIFGRCADPWPLSHHRLAAG
jgi:hypothetical protein